MLMEDVVITYVCSNCGNTGYDPVLSLSICALTAVMGSVETTSTKFLLNTSVIWCDG